MRNSKLTLRIPESRRTSDDQVSLAHTDRGFSEREGVTVVPDEQPEPGHDAWVRRQVQKALDDKKAGKANYKDFDEVAARFGFKRP